MKFNSSNSSQTEGTLASKMLTREEVAINDTWDLKAIFPNIEEWRAELKTIEESSQLIEKFRGRLHTSGENFREAIICYFSLQRKLSRVYVFAKLQSDSDTSNASYLGYLEEATGLYARVSAACSFLSPEILTIDPELLSSYLEDPLLAKYRRVVSEILRYQPHTLSTEEEKLLALASETLNSSQKIFSQLNNADLNFGRVKIEDKSVQVTHGSYSLLLKNPDRKLRKQVYGKYYRTFDSHRHTISAALSSSIKKDGFLAHARKFDSAREASLFEDQVTLSVYDNLIDTTGKHIESLHKYYALRNKILKLDKAKIYDTYVPIVSGAELTFSYDEAVQILCDSLLPLGKDYVDVLREGLTTNRWVDRYENKGKRSGAYSSGCYDSYPYILINYKNDLNSLFTLTHEAGHSMHSYFSRASQPFQDHEYTIFCAEVASTFNEQLLAHFLRKKYQSNPQALAQIVNHEIDDIKGTFFRQTMFAEFERSVHSVSEKNQPLTVDVFRKIYRKLLKKYFGSAVHISAVDTLECLRIPHFYSAFYVYKYATGIAAAINLADHVLSRDDSSASHAEALGRYMQFLKSGGSLAPLELLKKAGIDMTATKPIESAIKYFEKLVSELEGILTVSL